MNRSRRPFVLAPLLLALAAPLSAQANRNDDVNVTVIETKTPVALGREGVFPDGRNGISFETTICNTGDVKLDWRAPMSTRHPFICFLIARESDGRLVQISDRSYVKHGIAAANASDCGVCTEPFGNLLGIGCSDTYSLGLNGDRYTLGPPDEIDPWLGLWQRTCSLFDRGEPPVGGPAECDNVRSLNNQMAQNFGPVEHRIEVLDADLDVPGASFFTMTYYVVKTEPEKVRDDNMGTRRVTAAWTGSDWDFTIASPLKTGTILNRWSGATVTSAANGEDDGRVYVGVKVTGPVNGLYHYEYAFHNRDNLRGVGAVRIPICPYAELSGFGFKDVDADALNGWTATVDGDELVVSTLDNPLRWNSIYNLWFDTDAAPEAGGLELYAFDPGGGAPSVSVAGTVPTGVFQRVLAGGCGPNVPSLAANGRATLGNAGFALTSGGNTPGATNVLLAGYGPARTLDPGLPTGPGCTLWPGGSAYALSVVVTDVTGNATHPLPIPNLVGLEGVDLVLQCLESRAQGPGHVRSLTLSDGLLVRVGNTSLGCP